MVKQKKRRRNGDHQPPKSDLSLHHDLNHRNVGERRVGPHHQDNSRDLTTHKPGMDNSLGLGPPQLALPAEESVTLPGSVPCSILTEAKARGEMERLEKVAKEEKVERVLNLIPMWDLEREHQKEK